MAEYDILVECQVIIEANNEEEAENIAIKNIQNCLNPYYIEAYAEGQTVKRGRWELTDNPSFRKCSECGAWWSSDITDNYFTNYCPKCGTRMMKDGDTE